MNIKTSEMETAKLHLTKRTGYFKGFMANFELSLLALPGALFILLFCYIPMPGIILAFKKFTYAKGIFNSPWIGFENFKFLFMTDTVRRITINTVYLNIVFIITACIFSIALALMLFEITNRNVIKTYQTIIIFPNFLSWVVVSYMFYTIMSPSYGLVNVILKSMGNEAVDWYSKPEFWPFILMLTNLWKGGGMGSIIYYAVLMGIDKELFEAAKIDGATRLKMTRYISLPALVPMLTILLIMSIGGIIRADFGMFYNLTRDIPTLYSTTDVIDTYVYRALRTVGDPGMAAAAGFYQSVVGFALILISNLVVNRVKPENALF